MKEKEEIALHSRGMTHRISTTCTMIAELKKRRTPLASTVRPKSPMPLHSRFSLERSEFQSRSTKFSAQVLDNNQWIYDVTGMLQHCVAILKLCHATTEKLSSVPLTTISAQLNDSILRATNRIVPRFDDLLRAMAASQVCFYSRNFQNC